MCASLGAGAYTYRLVVLQFVALVILMMLSAWTRATTSSPTYTDAANLASGSCTPRQAEPTMKRSHTGGARGHGRREVAGRRGYFLRRGGLLLHAVLASAVARSLTAGTGASSLRSVPHLRRTLAPQT
jgi:hypothetical protein